MNTLNSGIYSLAEKMISLSGLKPHEDIQIIETGLRPGEKLYEKVLADKEQSLETHNNKILIARIRPKDYMHAKCLVDSLVKRFSSMSDREIVQTMKKIVPTYISNNSEYSELDQQETDTHFTIKQPDINVSRR